MSSTTDIPGTYVGAYAWCRDPSDRLLLVHVARGLDAGRWELEEETGISEVRQVKVAAIYTHTYARTAQRPYPPFHHIGIVYEVTPGTLDLRFEQDGSTDRCEWFTEIQARELPLVPLAEFAINLTWPE